MIMDQLGYIFYKFINVTIVIKFTYIIIIVGITHNTYFTSIIIVNHIISNKSVTLHKNQSRNREG